MGEVVDRDGGRVFPALHDVSPGWIASCFGSVVELQRGLWPEEAPIVANAVERRARQFEAGRSAARRALALLGIGPIAILRGAHGEPLWPDGIVGSITHSATLAAAAVARSTRYRGIGIDVEDAVPLKADLLATIATPRELERLDAFPPALRPLLGKALFSAKEAVYKCLWPTSRELIDFHDVEVELGGDPGLLRFAVSPLRPFSGHVLLAEGEGRVGLEGDAIVAAFLLPASRSEPD